MTDRPLITFALFAYNQEQFIREAVEAAFAQTYSPLEIILSDDGSTDRTFEIIQTMASAYTGPHTVILNQNQPNLGLISHVNKIFEMATADIVVVAAGDDISFPDRVINVVDVFKKHPDVFCVSLNYIIIDENGNLKPNGRKKFTKGKYTLDEYLSRKTLYASGATRAYKRKIFEVFGPLSTTCRVEDAPLIFRSILMGGFWHQSDFGAYYRVHKKNMTASITYGWTKSFYRQNMKDLKCAVKKNLLTKHDVVEIESVVKDQIVRSIIVPKYRKSRYKILCFVLYILFSKSFYKNTKKDFFVDSLRQLIPDRIMSIKRFIINKKPISFI